MLSCEYKEGIPVAIGAELKRRPWAHSLHHFAASLSITHTYHTVSTSGFFRCYKIMEMAWKHGQLDLNVGHVIWLFINCRYTTFKQHFRFYFLIFGHLSCVLIIQYMWVLLQFLSLIIIYDFSIYSVDTYSEFCLQETVGKSGLTAGFRCVTEEYLYVHVWFQRLDASRQDCIFQRAARSCK